MHTLVMLEGDKLIGTSSYCKGRFSEKESSVEIHPVINTENTDSNGEIVSFYLLPEYIGKGYGSWPLDVVINEMLNLGCYNIDLWVLEKNAGARRFYEKQDSH